MYTWTAGRDQVLYEQDMELYSIMYNIIIIYNMSEVITVHGIGPQYNNPYE